MSNKISEEKQIEIRNYYINNPISIKNLAKKFNISSPTAGKICKDIPRWTKNQIFSPDLNESWFNNIDSEEKAYYLGFFITDGNVCLTAKNAWICSLTQNEQDKYILEQWLKLIGSNRKIGNDGRGCYQAAIVSQTMAKDLKQYGVIPNKTDTTYLPSLSLELMPHLIRGILDGDGSIEAHWHLFPDGRYRFKHKIAFSGSYQLMNDINTFLNQQLNLKIQKEVYQYNNKLLSEIQYTNYDDIEKIGDYLYNNANIYLFRKKEKYDLIKERIKERQ